MSLKEGGDGMGEERQASGGEANLNRPWRAIGLEWGAGGGVGSGRLQEVGEVIAVLSGSTHGDDAAKNTTNSDRAELTQGR